MLINYEGSHDQQVFPQVGCRSPQLSFVGTSDSRKLIDLNKITLELECTICDADRETFAEGSIPVCFTNNTLHSLFSHAEVFLNGILISTSNNAYNHSAFIATKLTTHLGSKTIWTETQGNQYQGDKSTVEEVNKWKVEKFQQGKCTKNKHKLVGAPHIDIFEDEKFLLPGVTLHLRFHKSSNNFSLQPLAENDDNLVIDTERASVFVTKLIVKYSVRLSIEKALVNVPAQYSFIERMNKGFII